MAHRRHGGWMGLLCALALAGCGGGGGGGPGAAAGSGLLGGDPAAPANAAVANVAPQPAPEADIVDGLILSRLDVVFAADATVAQVNAALASVGATSISAARAGSLAMTVAVPRQPDAQALAALATTLEAQPGILAALPGPQALPHLAPPAPANADADFLYLQRARFPAAWNARAAAGDCSSDRVTVVVADIFHRPIDALYAQFPFQVPGAAELGSGTAAVGGLGGFHGYDVLTTLAANLDATVPTGAHPFPGCLDVKALQVAGLNPYAITAAIEDALAASSGKVVVNASFGWDACGVPDASGVFPPCTVANLNAPKARARAIWAGIQRQSLAAFADRTLVTASGGNEANKPVGATYAGAGIAGFGSAFNVAAVADATMSFASTGALWEPATPCTAAPCLPSLTATAADMANIAAVLANLGQSATVRAENVAIVGSVDNLLLQGSAFSDPGAPLLAVGEGIPTLLGVPVQGTSFSSPQVAALAAYLWLLSPELRARPARDALAAIKANASAGLVIDGVNIADGLINAYATVLSLDEAVAVTPATARIRLAILDVAGQTDAGGNVIGDGRFDLADLQAFRALYLDASGLPVEPAARTYSRFDLNGDGFTGGSRTTAMDLDPSGSTRFGAPLLGSASATIGGASRSFSESAVTDAQALCFYAHSALYTGDPVARDTVLAPLCSALPGATLSGALSLTATTVATNLTLVTQISIVVTAQVDSSGAIEVVSASGSGSETFTYVSSASFNCEGGGTATGRPPESKSGSAISASGTGLQDGDPQGQASVTPRLSGTRTRTTCSADGVWSTSSEPFEGSVSSGSVLGTPVVVNGATVAIDFNRDFVDEFGKHFVMSGRLQRQ